MRLRAIRLRNSSSGGNSSWGWNASSGICLRNSSSEGNSSSGGFRLRAIGLRNSSSEFVFVCG